MTELRRKNDRERWKLGPKFEAYLGLHFRIMYQFYGMVLLYALFYGAYIAMDVRTSAGPELENFFLYLLMFAVAELVGWYPRLCKESLYDSGAMLYMSIPVTSFETVLAKVIAGAVGFLIPMLVLGFYLFISLLESESAFLKTATFLRGWGFTSETMTAGTLLAVWVIAVLCVGAAAAALLAFAIGNRYRGRFSRWLKWIISVAVMLLLFALAGGALWLVWLMAFVPVLVRLLLIMAASVGLSVLLVRLNLAALEKWYCI